jgi:hypothetical protein
MSRTVIFLFALLAAAAPVMPQEQRLMDESSFKSFLSGLDKDSRRWTDTVTAVDTALLVHASQRRDMLVKTGQQTCLKTLGNLREQIARAETKNTFRNQIAILNGLTQASDSLGAFQNTLEFSDITDQEKAEKWNRGLTRAFEEASADSTRMIVHMSLLAEALDSKIDVNMVTKSAAKPAGKPQ